MYGKVYTTTEVQVHMSCDVDTFSSYMYNIMDTGNGNV